MIWKLNIVKMSILPKLICRFNTIKIKIPVQYFVDTDKFILMFMWKRKIPRIPNTRLKKKRKVGELKYCVSNLTIRLK